MELEGLQRGLAKIAEEELQVSHLVTDRHSQTKKYMREVHPEIVHWFDCSHIAKGKFVFVFFNLYSMKYIVILKIKCKIFMSEFHEAIIHRISIKID